MNKEFLIFFLASIRVIGMLITSPIFSLRQIPAFVKVALSIILGILISSTISPEGIVVSMSGFELVLSCGRELIIGVSIGYIANLIFSSVRTSAQLMDFNIGFSMAQYYDPSTAGTSTPLERFFNWVAMVIFLTFNFHHIIISAVLKSFEVAPIGKLALSSGSFVSVMNTFSNSFYIAIQLAAPIVIVLFITDLTLGLIARTVPQLNIFILGMPVKVLVGLLAITAILPGLTHMYVKTFDGLSKNIMNLFTTFPVLFLMADDKTEEPTSKKLSDARKKGQVAKSVDLTSAIILFGITIIFSLFGDMYYSSGKLMIIESFKNIRKIDLTTGDISVLFIGMIKNGLMAALPVILTVLILGVVANIAQSGFLLTSESIKPKLDKLNPIEGFKKIFSRRSLVELIKSISKITIIAYVAFSFIKGKIFDILKTSDLNANGIFPFVKSVTDSQLVRLVIVMMIIGITDFVFQKRQYKRDLRMTKQEIKEEYKQSEGDPNIKSKIKQKQREMSMRRMMHEVPKATVVVTNPTHFAVAIKYDKGEGVAPRVVAKGADLVAQKIKGLAKDSNVPVIENKHLARTLFARVEIDEEIPVELYQAVAEIIAYVYSIKKM